MMKDYSNQNFSKATFVGQDLRDANFSGSDLRGTNFTGSDLSGADFTKVKTGIPVPEKVILFFVSLAISLLSGYIAALAGQTVQAMYASEDPHVKKSGILASAIILLFIIFAVWKGGRNAIRHLGIPIFVVCLTIAIVSRISGFGTGQGMLYLVLAFFLVILMFVVGTIARSAAGTLSNLLFVVVALSGGMFAKSIGGGIGTLIMAIACALISKRAMAGVKGFEWLRNVGAQITIRFGTSFRDTKMANAMFSGSEIHNSDFSGADTSTVHWGDSKKINCTIPTNR